LGHAKSWWAVTPGEFRRTKPHKTLREVIFVLVCVLPQTTLAS
jgi:hypothetical protein